jgi:heat shock protein HslJ
MGNTPFTQRLAMPLCAIALMCSGHSSFAQPAPGTYDGKPYIIGHWDLVSIDGRKAEGQKETMIIGDESISVREDCNSATYKYVIIDGLMTATPDGITLMACNEDRTPEEEMARHNQDAIVAAITRSEVLLNGNTLKVQSYSRYGELEFHRMDW